MRSSIFSLRSGASSPAPPTPSRQDSGVFLTDVVEPLSLPPLATATVDGATARSRPLSRLGLSGFRKSSPAARGRDSPTPSVPTPPASPAPPSAVSTIPGSTPGSVSYLDALSLKLGEAVSKALVTPNVPIQHTMMLAKAPSPNAPVANGVKVVEGSDSALKGKKPLPPGRGRTLGNLIASELQAASQDPFLYRAVLRLLQRPLSVLLTNLTTQVTNLILAPEFHPNFPLPSVLNPTQVHALAFARFASELLETFDAIGMGKVAQRNQSAGDGLRPDREALESVVSKVVGPLVAAIRAEINAAVAEAERDPPSVGQLEKVIARVAPIVARVTFAGEANQSSLVQSTLATFGIGTIWQCLLALANRPLPRSPSVTMKSVETDDEKASALRKTASAGELRSQPSSDSLQISPSLSNHSLPPDYANQLPSYVTPPDTPQLAPVAMKEKEARAALTLSQSTTSAKAFVSPGITPSSSASRLLTPPSTKKLSLVKLPSLKPLTLSHPITRTASPPHLGPTSSSDSAKSQGSSSASSSPVRLEGSSIPNSLAIALKALARDATVLQGAIKKLPVPVEGGLARDAVDEAANELAGFVSFVDYLALSDEAHDHLTLERRLADIPQLVQVTRQTPMLLSMPILLRVCLSLRTLLPATAVADDTVASWIGLSDLEYRRTCLSAFGKADECAPIVGKAFMKNRRSRTTGMAWMRDWVERSVKEEEEGSDSSDEE